MPQIICDCYSSVIRECLKKRNIRYNDDNILYDSIAVESAFRNKTDSNEWPFLCIWIQRQWSRVLWVSDCLILIYWWDVSITYYLFNDKKNNHVHDQRGVPLTIMSLERSSQFNVLRSVHNGFHFTEDILKFYLLLTSMKNAIFRFSCHSNLFQIVSIEKESIGFR